MLKYIQILDEYINNMTMNSPDWFSYVISNEYIEIREKKLLVYKSTKTKDKKSDNVFNSLLGSIHD